MNHLSGVLTDQFCYFQRRTDLYECSPKEYHRMCGTLFSAIISSLRPKQYRLRLHFNGGSKSSQNFCTMRFFGCLSYEESPDDAQLNRYERLNNYNVLHTEINPRVSLIPCARPHFYISGNRVVP